VSGAPVVAAVVSWNTRDLLARCLDSLRDPRVEVHVVDNGSADGSPELVRERYGWATLHEPGNVGFGPAVNLVAARTASPWLLAANADTAAEPGALDALLEAGARDRRAGAVAPRLVLPDGSDQHSAYPFPTLPFLALFNAGLAERRLGDRLCLEGRWDARRARRVPWAVAAFLLLRRPAFDAVGGFDPDQWMYAEDLDLGWRLRAAGWATRTEPRAVVRHASAASTAQAWGDERTLRWQAATYDWLRRRRGPARARAAYALNLAGAVARTRTEREPWRRERARAWAAMHRRAWRLGRPAPSALPQPPRGSTFRDP
jgi:N-acetylglucosaminyl-diphospho-decaprenol L-rhamnosyltransferase